MVNNYGTIVRMPLFDQTAFEGNPADDVGTSMIERLFTKVVHTLFAVMHDPAINESLHDALLHLPPITAEKVPLTVLRHPPFIIE